MPEETEPLISATFEVYRSDPSKVGRPLYQ